MITPSECLLCGRAARAGGVFMPNESFAKRIGQPAGKLRIVFYGLCAVCFDLPRVLMVERVEAKLLREMTIQ
jgi:hypothetical protein